jgi:hypothetical protein
MIRVIVSLLGSGAVVDVGSLSLMCKNTNAAKPNEQPTVASAIKNKPTDLLSAGAVSALERRQTAGMDEQGPLPQLVAWRAVGRCAIATVRLITRRALHMPRAQVGTQLHFADGTTARVYRLTTIDGEVHEPCQLVVGFRLRFIRGRFLHGLFRLESWLNTPLFAGFPGLASKLWCAHDANDLYRGVYEWDGVEAARAYARSLWRVLALVSEADSIQYVVRGPDDDRLLPDWARIVN